MMKVVVILQDGNKEIPNPSTNNIGKCLISFVSLLIFVSVRIEIGSQIFSLNTASVAWGKLKTLLDSQTNAQKHFLE